MARLRGGKREGGGVANGDACGWRSKPAAHRERVATPQPPDKTAHRLQHTEIEHAWVEPQIACELRQVMRKTPKVPKRRNPVSSHPVDTPFRPVCCSRTATPEKEMRCQSSLTMIWKKHNIASPRIVCNFHTGDSRPTCVFWDAKEDTGF